MSLGRHEKCFFNQSEMALGQNQKRPMLIVYLDNAVVVIDGMTKSGGLSIEKHILRLLAPITRCLGTGYWLLLPLRTHTKQDVTVMLAITARELKHKMHHTPSTRASMYVR